MTISYPNLPGLTENGTVIDGSDRWDTAWDRPGVEVGEGLAPNGVLVIAADSCTVQGLRFFGGNSTGIRIYDGNNNIIGGSGEHQRNVFDTDGTSKGVWIEGNGLGNQIINNYFGTINGTSTIGMQYGIFIQTSGQTIKDNLIVGASVAGILLWSDDNNVEGNIIGMDKFKSSALPNNEGILVETGNNNTIGPDNWIMGNTSNGIRLHNSNTTNIFSNEVGDWSTSFGLKNGGDGKLESKGAMISATMMAAVCMSFTATTTRCREILSLTMCKTACTLRQAKKIRLVVGAATRAPNLPQQRGRSTYQGQIVLWEPGVRKLDRFRSHRGFGRQLGTRGLPGEWSF
jgi:hypothetical protein